MKIKSHLISLAIFMLLSNQLAVFVPIKTQAALPPRDNFTFAVLAAGERTSVLAQTGQNVTTPHNGSEWYYNPNSSMGFASIGASISQSTADVSAPSDPLRLSWHLSSNQMTGGYRAGATIDLNGSTA